MEGPTLTGVAGVKQGLSGSRQARLHQAQRGLEPVHIRLSLTDEHSDAVAEAAQGPLLAVSLQQAHFEIADTEEASRRAV